MKSVHLILFLFITTSIIAQDSVNIIVSNRVNFEADSNKKLILGTYKNYLASLADSAYDNPYTATKEDFFNFLKEVLAFSSEEVLKNLLIKE